MTTSHTTNDYLRPLATAFGAYIHGTGGGCDAFRIELPDGTAAEPTARELLVVDGEGACVPEADTACVVLCLFSDDGEVGDEVEIMDPTPDAVAALVYALLGAE